MFSNLKSNNRSTFTSDVVIVGGGGIGTCLAYWLAKAGAQVALLEKDSVVAGPGTASYASAGMLSPAATQDTPPAMLSLMQRGLALYPALIAELEQAQVHPTGYTRLPQLRVALNGAEVRNLQKRQSWYVEQNVIPEARWLTPQEVREIEPMVGPNYGAIHHQAAVVRSAWLTQALAEAARLKGAIIQCDSPVGSLLTEGSRVKGVRLTSGESWLAEKIVLASGAWAGQWLDKQLAEIDLVLPLFNFVSQVWPVRGQMLAVQPGPSPDGLPPLRHLLAGAHGYAYPRPDGSVVFGATVEPNAGFEAHTTPAGYLELGRLVHKLTPALDNAPIKESWAGLRPGSASELPLLGPLPELDGLWLSVGHFRSGIMLAPASAELLSQALLTNDSSGLQAFKPDYRI